MKAVLRRQRTPWILLALIGFSDGCYVPQVYHDRGVELQRQGRWEAAIEQYSRAVELDTKYAEAYMNRGGLWSEVGEYEKAVEDYTRVIEIDPSRADAFLQRGLAYIDMGEYDLARASLDRALELDPYSARACNGLAELCERTGDLAGSVDRYSRAIRLDPNNAIAFYSRGAVRERLSLYAEAIGDYEKAAALSAELAPKALQRINACRKHLRDRRPSHELPACFLNQPSRCAGNLSPSPAAGAPSCTWGSASAAKARPLTSGAHGPLPGAVP